MSYVIVKTASGEEYYVPSSKISEYTKKKNISEITIPGAGTHGGAKKISAGKGKKLVVPKSPSESYYIESPSGVSHKVPSNTKVYGYIEDASGQRHYTSAKIGTKTIAGAKFHPMGVSSLEVTPFGIRPKGWNLGEETKELQHGKLTPVGRRIKEVHVEDIQKNKFTVPLSKRTIDRSITTPEIKRQAKMEAKEKELENVWYKYHGKPVENIKKYGRPEASFIIKTAETAGFTQASSLMLSPELRKKTAEYITEYPSRVLSRATQSMVSMPLTTTREIGEAVKAGDIATVGGIIAGTAFQLAVFHKFGEVAGKAVNVLDEKMPTVREATIDITDVRGINLIKTSLPEEKSTGIGFFETKKGMKGIVESFVEKRKGGETIINTRLRIPEQKIGRVRTEPFTKDYYGKVLKSTDTSSIVAYSEKAEDVLKFRETGTKIRIEKGAFEMEKTFEPFEAKRTLTGKERIIGYGKKYYEKESGEFRLTKTRGFTIKDKTKMWSLNLFLHCTGKTFCLLN